MQVTKTIFMGLIVVTMISMFMLFSDYSADKVNKFEEKRLTIAVNYAVDAATKEMRIQSANLAQDYATIQKINVDPSVALDIFATILCENYNVPVNDTNKSSILTDYVPYFMVCAYDGYYLANHETINSSGVQQLIFDTKMPYKYLDKSTNTLYSLNLSLNDGIAFKEGKVWHELSIPLTKKEQSDVINSMVSDVMNENLVKYAHTSPRGEIFIPSQLTSLHSTNPIKNTTVLAYIDNFDMGGIGTNLQTFAIGGSEIKQKKVVIGFEVAGQKFYAYADKVPTGMTPLESFDSQEDAAGAGYYFYVQ